MTLELVNVPEPMPSPGGISRLIFHLIANAAGKLAHGFDHPIVIHIIKERLCMLMVPVGVCSTLFWLMWQN